MQKTVTLRILLFVAGLILVPSLTYLVILFARGYRPDPSTKTISPTGLLVATSNPDGAQIYINGTLLSATNTTTNLSPGHYEVEIKKDGFQPWKKTLTLEPEIVTSASATLFPSVPSLKAITSSGAAIPSLSPDGTHVAFIQSTQPTSPRLYLLDLTESPLGLINREPKLISNLPANWRVANLIWSPNSRQILVDTASSSAYLVDTSSTTSTLTVTSTTLANWLQRQTLLDFQKLSTLSPILVETLATSSASLVWSPKENKLLYTATASAYIPDILKKPLPGSNSQPQQRYLIPSRVYVYDLEEDRNFSIDEGTVPTPSPSLGLSLPKKSKTLAASPLLPTTANAGWSWFPDSGHLIKVNDKQVTIMEYDSTNPTVVYSGPMENSYAFPYPSGKQVLILSNLNPSLSSQPNLYALSLK